MEENETQTQETSSTNENVADQAISETIDFYKQKYEQEKALREKSDKEVVNLTKMLRNATIQPKAEEKPKNSEQLIAELFDEGGDKDEK